MKWRHVSLMASTIGVAAGVLDCEQKKTRVEEMIANASEPSPAEDAAATREARLAASAPPPIPRQRPPRPLPPGKWGPVQPTAPLEIQQKTLAYTYAMATPDPGDGPVDKGFLEAFRAKLEQAVRAMDPTGGDRISVNPAQGDRRMEVEMSTGCNERTPFNLAVQRAGMPFTTLAQSGIYVIQCHDSKWKCIQSTREPDDVICVAAPRR
ncbi:MAG TPA: hypothetical protein VK540_06330 [Polyangiaceae bacterium]|jgi:hypothetical protein|nr:hypothetical protein [Polyangiaceae bacterium]